MVGARLSFPFEFLLLTPFFPSINSLLLKYQDMQCVANCDNPDPREHVAFKQPVWQTLQMFAGEVSDSE